MKSKILLLTCMISLTITNVAGAAVRYIYPSYAVRTEYSDSTHWDYRFGHWMCADKDFHQALCNAWINTNGNWYYVDEEGYMAANAWINGYYVDNNGVMKTGWAQIGSDWFYFYSDGTKAVNTTVDGYYLGADGKWIKNA